MKCPIITLDNETAGEIELADSVFGARRRARTSWSAWSTGSSPSAAPARTRPRASARSPAPPRSRTSRRAPAAPARARLRSPQFRGGGKCFGPVVRSHAHRPAEEGARAGAEAARCRPRRPTASSSCSTAAAVDEAKTKAARQQLEKLGLDSVLIIDGAEVDQNFAPRLRATCRISTCCRSQGANVYDILRRDTLVLTRDAVAASGGAPEMSGHMNARSSCRRSACTT